MTVQTSTAHALGDPVPDTVAGYYRALDGNRFEAATAAFSEDVLYAVPPLGAVETAPRVETVGRAALLAWFEGRGARAWAHEVLLCAVEDRTCLLEGVSHDTADGRVVASFVASLRLADDGTVARYLAWGVAPAVSPSPGEAATGTEATGDAAGVLARYFDALDAGAFEDAAACFSSDVVYSHPPYRHTGIDSDRRVELHGRDALLANFRARGVQRFDHHVLACLQRGPHCLVEGRVEHLPGGRDGSFVSSLTLDGDGLVRRYVSFYCEPAVPTA